MDINIINYFIWIGIETDQNYIKGGPMKYQCKRCGYTWTGRLDTKPKQCQPARVTNGALRNGQKKRRERNEYDNK